MPRDRVSKWSYRLEICKAPHSTVETPVKLKNNETKQNKTKQNKTMDFIILGMYCICISCIEQQTQACHKWVNKAHWGLVTPMAWLGCFNSPPTSAAYMRQWIGWTLVQVMACANSAPSHYLNQWWDIINWALRNKLQWNFNQNTKLFIQQNA